MIGFAVLWFSSPPSGINHFTFFISQNIVSFYSIRLEKQFEPNTKGLISSSFSTLFICWASTGLTEPLIAGPVIFIIIMFQSFLVYLLLWPFHMLRYTQLLSNFTVVWYPFQLIAHLVVDISALATERGDYGWKGKKKKTQPLLYSVLNAHTLFSIL